MEYKIYGSGSSGNAVKIDNMLFDVGLPIKTLQPIVDDVDIIFISHIHGDHINTSTIKHFQAKIIIAPQSVIDMLPSNLITRKLIVAEDKRTLEILGYVIQCTELVHGGVECFGWDVTFPDGKKLFYATDTSTLKQVPLSKKYDYLFVESNYDEWKWNAMFEKARNENERKRLLNNKRHLSKQQSMEFYLEHSNKGALYIELHKSRDFY